MNLNQNGKKNPNYKHGKSTYQHYCKCGKEISWKSNRCQKCSPKGKEASNYIDGRSGKKYYCKESNCDNGISYYTWKHGQGRCKTCSNRRCWKLKKFSRKKLLKALIKFPNKPEKLLKKMLNKLLPKEYKYVGNGEIIFGGFNPDFINCNGQKKIIEIYGDYWHNRKEVKIRDRKRLGAYKKYGYKTLIIWEHELKNIDKVQNTIKEFTYA